MSETELLAIALSDCNTEIAEVERRLYQLESMRRKLEYDIVETAREQERDYA